MHDYVNLHNLCEGDFKFSKKCYFQKVKYCSMWFPKLSTLLTKQVFQKSKSPRVSFVPAEGWGREKLCYQEFLLWVQKTYYQTAKTPTNE